MKKKEVEGMAAELWTIGHSTRTHEDFFDLLDRNGIDALVDVRSYPSSKFCPQWNQQEVFDGCREYQICYEHMPVLGGKRKALPIGESLNGGLRNASFRGYADYMQMPDFRGGVRDLLGLVTGVGAKVAIMCAEAVWWRCHRSMIADALSRCYGVDVWHIMGPHTITAHPRRDIAVQSGNRLIYPVRSEGVRS